MKQTIAIFSILVLATFIISSGIASPPSSIVTAASIQLWSVNNGFYTLNVFGDGTILAARHDIVVGPQVPGGNGVEAAKLNPVTGDVIESIFSPNVRTTIRLSPSPSELDWMMGGHENWSAFKKDGTYAKVLYPIGCCNVPKYPFAYDHINDRAYIAASSGIGYVDIQTDARPFLGITGNFFGMVSLADETTAYTAGQQGIVSKTNSVSGYVWQTPAIDSRLQPGAVAADGSFVVTSGFSHFEGTTQPGRLALVTPGGTVAWNNFVNAVTPPVIGSNGLIFVGVQPAPISESGPGAIEAYDPANGNLVWSVPVDGLPNDLLVGDDGAVYAGTGGYGSGRVYSIAQSDGDVRQVITDVTAAWEIILRAGLIYASGKEPFGPNTSITALPVAANNYDLGSPWPVRYHDNQRTSNRTHPILTPPRISTPTPTPTPTPSPTPVPYDVQVLYDQTKAHKSGSTVPIKIRLVDANGNNVSSASIDVHAVSVIQTSSQASTILDDAGNANPDFDFRYDAELGGYVYNLKTTGYGTGTYVLNFVISGGAQAASVGFQVRQ